MKQSVKRFYGTLACVAFFSGLTGAFAYSLTQQDKSEVSAQGQDDPSTLMTVSDVTVPAGQPVDLTVAAEKACNAVVYIKCVQTSKTQIVEYTSPFEDFFGDFFGRGGGTQRRQMQTPKRESAGSGVIISEDGG